MKPKIKSALLRYGLGLLSFALTLSLAILFRRYSIGIDLGFLVVLVLIAVSWYGGTGPGLVVLALFESIAIISAAQSQSAQALTAKYIFAQINLLALLGIVVVLVGERKKSDRRIREQREWLEVTLSSIGDAVIATDIKGRINFMNPAAECLVGKNRAEVANRSLDEIFQIVEEDTSQTIEGTASNSSTLESLSFERASNVILVSREGTKKPISYSKSPIRDNAGQVTGMVLVFRDVSEQRQAEAALRSTEEQLLQAQKMEAVGRLAGGIAHDFNNLLTAIVGYSELALRRIQPEDRLRQEIDEIRKAGERAATLTSQLLAFSRKQVLQPRILDINTVIADTSRMLNRLIGEDIRFRSRLDPELRQVKVDPGQIEQVLMNLAVNARDAMPGGGSLSIETANVYLDEEYARLHAEVRPGHYVMLAVSDTGCGIDTKTMAHIFEPFFTTKEIGKGTGLGLATVYGIVKQSGGHIWVYSEPQKGTTFKVYLPQAEESKSLSAEPIRSDLLPIGRETVLLAEDDYQVRELAHRVLQELGYRVIEASNGDDALKVALQTKDRIDILLTDVVMPHIGGKELSGRLKERKPELKVLYLSGYTADSIVHHGVLDEGVAFLHKPFTPGELARKVREVLDVAAFNA